MNLLRLLLLFFVLMIVSVPSFLVSADNKSPVISFISQINDGTDLILEIKGGHFGNNPKAVQLVINDNGTVGEVIKAKPKKLVVKVSTSDLCSGTATLRVLVDKIPSNPATLDLKAGIPVIESIEPKHAQPGSIIQLKGANFGCQATGNAVTFNGSSADILAVGRNSLSVRVPAIAHGATMVRINVAGQFSSPLAFNIDPAGNSIPGGTDTGTTFHFKEASGVPGAAGFAPMFAINKSILFEGLESSLWDAGFSGKHQAIVKAPWKTVNGDQQIALLTIVCLRSNSLVGNSTGGWEKFVYARVNYPVDPHLPFNQENNPFWWGSAGIATEHHPEGGLYFNSVSRATGGVDSFEMSQAVPGQASLAMTMKVVTPDLFKYQRYGENFEKAGIGIVFMPKVAMIRVEFDQIDMRFPIAQYNIGKVTVTDESGLNGTITTERVQFRSSILDPGDINSFEDLEP